MAYTNKSQIARVMTESWMSVNGYCLACDSDKIVQTAGNTEARDFECPRCGHPYELKSSIKPFGNRVVDGAFSSMMRRIEANSVSSFLLMRYTASAEMIDLTAIHRSFITPNAIMRRKPLNPSAKRAGWVGCNILLSEIPPEGRIPLMLNHMLMERDDIRRIFRATDSLANNAASSRGWSGALLKCLHTLPHGFFTIDQAYSFESYLSGLYPSNRHIRPKIRQQLQVLRDAGLLEFKAHGEYRLAFGFPNPRSRRNANHADVDRVPGHSGLRPPVL